MCVADRENGRVQCFHHSNGSFHSQYHSPVIGDRLFSVAYAPIKGGQLFVVNGPPTYPTMRMEVKGFIIDMTSGNVTAKFPDDANFTNPHDVAVTEDGAEVYVVEYEPYLVHKLVSVDRRIGAGEFLLFNCCCIPFVFGVLFFRSCFVPYLTSVGISVMY